MRSKKFSYSQSYNLIDYLAQEPGFLAEPSDIHARWSNKINDRFEAEWS